MLTLFKVYARALGLLAAEKWLSCGLVAANVAIALILLAEPILFGKVVDAIAGNGEPFALIALWAVLGLIGLMGTVLIAVFADRMAHRQRLAAMSAAFERAITLPISYHADRGSTRLVHVMLAGADALAAVWLTFLREHLAAFVSLVFLVPTAIAISSELAIVLAVLAAFFAAANAVIIRRTHSRQREIEGLHQSLSSRVGDVIGNVTIVQSYTRMADESVALRSMMAGLLKAQYPVLTWWAVLTVLTRAAATITMVCVFMIGTVLASRGSVSVGEIVSFVGFASLMIAKLDQLSNFVARIFQQAAQLTAFYDVLDASPGVVMRSDAPPLADADGHVAFEDVTYRFARAEQGVFNLSFSLSPGQSLALVGPTGAGKTTALALLQRLRDPQSGRITIGGQDIRDVSLDSLRANVSVVFQDTGLFNRSIAENIRIGRPGATAADVEAAARLAEAHEFITQKPGGYDFVIGERGAALSGGERQRLAIARAIVKNAPILILDEATSALDNETEAHIQRALDALRQGRTTFIIAHRLSTVANADQIAVMARGRIVEIGTFGELAMAGGLFSRLVDAGGLAVQPAPRPAIAAQ